ncbi:polymorphic toxin type 44 domain-containing protein, partial [Streptococcus pyogenes]
SDSIIKAYEDYLYSLNKEAFDKYWNVRKRTVKWNPQKDKQAAEAEKQLSIALKKSGINIKDVMQQMGSDILSVNSKAPHTSLLA